MTRTDDRRSVRGDVDAIRAELDAADGAPIADRGRLTPAECTEHDRLIAKARNLGGEALEPARVLARLSYDELCILRAIERKATGELVYTTIASGSPDFRDSQILRALNANAQGG